MVIYISCQSYITYVRASLKPVFHYAFLACVWSENARGFALGKLHNTFLLI